MRFRSDLNYFDMMASAQKFYAKLLNPICEEWGLTRNELDILLFLYNHPEYDRAADIVSHRGIAKSHVSLSVASLEEKSLLLRRFDESDRRTAHLELIGHSTVITAQARDLQTRYFSALYQGISQEEFEIWGNIVEKVYKNIASFEINP